MANTATDTKAKTVCHIAKSGGGKKFNSDSGRYSHFYNTILESHRLYEKDSPKWGEFFTEFSGLNLTNTFSSVEQALVERKKIIDSFNLPRKVSKNAAYAFQLFLSASDCLAPDWRTSEFDRKIWQDYFDTCEKWVKKYFPGIILSTAVHYDEKTPHMHVNIIPIRRNMPVYHNEKVVLENGQYAYNSKGAIKTRKVMTVDAKGCPVLETKYTSGSFINPEELGALQTDFARAVRHFGVERGEMNSQKEHESLRVSTRINARKIQKEEARLKKIEAELETKAKQLERRASLISDLLSVPLKEFKIEEPERKLLPSFYEWEYNGQKCKNFEEYRTKIIEDQVSRRVYQADLLVKQKDKQLCALNSSLLKKETINTMLQDKIASLEKLLLNGSVNDIENYRSQIKASSTRKVRMNIPVTNQNVYRH